MPLTMALRREAERAENNKSPVSAINISAVLQGHYVIIAVEDDGRGIEPGMIRREIVHRGFMMKKL